MNAVPNSPSAQVDVEAIAPIVDRTASTHFGRHPDRAAAPSTDSTTSQNTNTPEALRSWFSIKIFRTVLFCIFIIMVFTVTSIMLFTDKMSIDQWLGSTSSLLFLMSPSPLDTLRRNKDKGNK